MTANPIPSLRSFCILVPCMPRLSGRRISGPCCSRNETKGRYLAISLKFLDCVSSIN